MTSLKNPLTVVFLLIACYLSLTAVAQSADIQKVESQHFKNLYKLNDSLYRSEQPSKKGFKELQAMGVKTVINFRRHWNDDRKARKTDIELNKFALESKKLSGKDLIHALQLVIQAEKPVLIHCWHGSDRTGAVSAAYRMVVEAWPKERAIAELRMEELGYHENLYPNIVMLIEGLDVASIRTELGL